MELPVKMEMAQLCNDCLETFPELVVKYWLDGCSTVKYTCNKCYEKIGPEVREFMANSGMTKIIEDWR